MKKLSKEQDDRRTELIEELRAIKTKLEGAYATYAVGVDGLNGIVHMYNEKAQEIETFRGEITADMESYIDEKSERWQEGDAGQEYVGWKDEWDGLDISELETLTAEDLPELTLDDDLEALPAEPG